jgi:hypothetical protein
MRKRYRRRTFLRSAAALGASLSLPLRAFAAPAALTPRRLYFDDPERTAPRLSPDGRHIAFIAPLDGVRNLWLAPRRPANRLAFNAVAEAFLAKHLGGAFEPVGEAFAGSTLKVETGAELVPGLS